MAATNEVLKLSTTFEDASEFQPDIGSVYIFGASNESRSGHAGQWKSISRNVTIITISGEQRDVVGIELPSGSVRQVALRSAKQLEAFWQPFRTSCVYLDMTGLRHSTWAALIRGASGICENLFVVYVEPITYRISMEPTESEIYRPFQKFCDTR